MKFTRTKSAAVVAASPPAIAVVATSPADAAGKKYSNCDALHRDFKHGVAKSAASANKQVRDGYGRPATTKRTKDVYRTNKANLDRDKDGAACEA